MTTDSKNEALNSEIVTLRNSYESALSENKKLVANTKFCVHAINELKQNLENAISRSANLSVQVQDLTEEKNYLQKELEKLRSRTSES